LWQQLRTNLRHTIYSYCWIFKHNYMESQHGRSQLESSLLWKPQISHLNTLFSIRNYMTTWWKLRESKRDHAMQISSFMQTAYNANLKSMVIRYAEQATWHEGNNVRQWRKVKELLGEILPQRNSDDLQWLLRTGGKSWSS